MDTLHADVDMEALIRFRRDQVQFPRPRHDGGDGHAPPFLDGNEFPHAYRATPPTSKSFDKGITGNEHGPREPVTRAFHGLGIHSVWNLQHEMPQFMQGREAFAGKVILQAG